MRIRLKAFLLLLLCFAAGIVDVVAQANRINPTGIVEQIVIEGSPVRQVYVLQSDSGRRYQLSASKDLEPYTNKHVTISGTLKDGLLDVQGEIVLDAKNESLPLPPPTFGSRKTLFIMANFTNDQSQGMTPEQARAPLFTDPDSVDKLFRAASGGRYGLTGIQNPLGDIVGWVTIPFTNENCESRMFGQWTDAADAAARAAGVEPNNYNSVLYIFPSTPFCSLNYLGTLGDPGSPQTQRSWYQAKTGGLTLFNKAVAHEIGHNLGLHHASAYRCSGPNIPADCTADEYGDPACLMSDANDFSLQFPNNYYMLRLGWLDADKVTRLDTPGSYTVTLHSPGSWVKGVKGVQIPLRNANGQLSGKSYFLEARRAVPFDVFTWSGLRAYTSGIGIRYAPDDIAPRPSRTYLIDTTPATATFGDAPLGVGRTYNDSVYGVSITTLSTNPVRGMRVRIELSR